MNWDKIVFFFSLFLVSLASLMVSYFPESICILEVPYVLLFMDFQNISPGMKLWGLVAEVNDKDIVVSLPGGLRGLVLANEAHDPLPDNKIIGVHFFSCIQLIFF